MDALTLARIQFGLTAAFHYIFPSVTIGLALLLVYFEWRWLKTGSGIYEQLARFWTKIFAIAFAFGVASGVVMEFQFGTNWSAYARFVGDVFGSPLAAEAILAFFLESCFLGIVVFGWEKVSRRFHFFATCMVCLGAHLSALWIIVANSWMHTPAGFKIVETPAGPRAEITDFWQMVFNPSTLDRLSHVLSGCWQAGAFLVASVSAFYLLKGKHIEFARAGLKPAIWYGTAAAVLSLLTGHQSAVGVAKHQPAKLAAFEGLYETQSNAPLTLVGWINEQQERAYVVGVPGLLSVLVHGDASKPIPGLREFKPEDRPPVNLTFQAYHIMIAIGFSMIGLGVISLLMMWRGRAISARWLLRLLTISFLGPQIANQAGWLAAEVGRQPWVVYGLLRTEAGVSPNVSAGAVLGSLIMFVVVYGLLLAIFIWIMLGKVRHGPEPDAGLPKSDEAGAAK
ncbi:MAG: cytochrome ubiquinol oxidase subunit I [Verrucomicrobiales bacterium]|nr:cytochrome ubiquinol oxidase subunit I [Verrucomicrobiales bacterium]